MTTEAPAPDSRVGTTQPARDDDRGGDVRPRRHPGRTGAGTHTSDPVRSCSRSPPAECADPTFPRMLRNGGYIMPIICGHEFSGWVTELGEGVEGFDIGELVSVPPLIPCRNCDFCAKGAFGLCENYDYFGSRCDGAYAQYVVSPVGNLLKLPSGIDPRAAAMLDPAAIALHGLWKTNLEGRAPGPGDRERDRSDFFAVQWAKLHGAGQIVAVDLSEEKAAMACEAGATHAVQGIEEARALGGRGFDIVLESAGVPATADMAANLTGPQGHAVFVGIPHAPVTLDKDTFNKFMRLETSLHGSWNSFLGAVPGRRVAPPRLRCWPKENSEWEFGDHSRAAIVGAART